MTQLEQGSVDPEGVTDLLLGSVLSGGGGAPAQNDAAGWYRMVKDYQDAALDTRLGIPILYGVDAVHGHNNVIGATIFPQQVGLGASHDVGPREAHRRGDGARDGRDRHPLGLRPGGGGAAGRPMGPHLRGLRRGPARGREARRGVHHGPPGRRPDRVPRRRPRPPSTTSATAARRGARRRRPGYSIDQGVNDVDEATFRAIHLAPYETAHRGRCPDRDGVVLEHGRGQGPRRPPPAHRRPQGRARVQRVRRLRLGRRRPGRRRTTTRRSRRRSRPASTWSWSRATARGSRPRSRPVSRTARSTRRGSTTRSPASSRSSSRWACSSTRCRPRTTPQVGLRPRPHARA